MDQRVEVSIPWSMVVLLSSLLLHALYTAAVNPYHAVAWSFTMIGALVALSLRSFDNDLRRFVCDVVTPDSSSV